MKNKENRLKGHMRDKLKKLKIVTEVVNPDDKAIYSRLPNVNTTDENLFADRTITTICL